QDTEADAEKFRRSRFIDAAKRGAVALTRALQGLGQFLAGQQSAHKASDSSGEPTRWPSGAVGVKPSVVEVDDPPLGLVGPHVGQMALVVARRLGVPFPGLDPVGALD